MASAYCSFTRDDSQPAAGDQGNRAMLLTMLAPMIEDVP